jgi:exopolysaccharide biosynthesis polyprenyl glycosylphosphotransferase
VKKESLSPIEAPGASASSQALTAGEGVAGVDLISGRPHPAENTILKREVVFRRTLGLVDATAITITLLCGALVFGSGGGLAWAALAVPLVFVGVAKAIGLYDRDAHLLHKTTLDEVPALFSLATASVLLLWAASGLLVSGDLGQAQILPMWALLFVLLLALRSLARWTARRVVPTERCLFVGDTQSAEHFRDKLAASPSVKAELVGWIPADRGGTDARGNGRVPLPERVRALVAERDVHRVVLGPGSARSEEVLDAVRQTGGHAPKVSVLPDVSRVVSSSVEVDRLNGITLLGVRRFEITRSSHVVKRAFDLAGSCAALLVLFPLLVATAIAIRLDSRGPVLFRQARAGRHGEPFEMLKFRSMVDGAEHQRDDLMHLNEADGVFKIADDPRITRVGRVIRRLHIDEMPQLVNVLRGDMSLVGPRPLPLDEDRRIVGWHRRRLDLRPGITGPWQVLGSSRIPLSEMVRLDYQYIADWSVWNDVRILLREKLFPDLATEVLRDRIPAGLQARLLDVDEGYRVAVLGEDMGDAVAHGSGTDNGDLLDLHATSDVR